jgi:ubiquinone/menaquinone biosynthesis C-methylase UbiE
VKALQEMHRVLRPGGRAVVIDLKKDASVRDIDHYVENAGVSWLSGIFMKLTFRTMLLKRAYTKAQFQEFISQTSFRKSEIRADGIGFEISLEK